MQFMAAVYIKSAKIGPPQNSRRRTQGEVMGVARKFRWLLGFSFKSWWPNYKKRSILESQVHFLQADINLNNQDPSFERYVGLIP